MVSFNSHKVAFKQTKPDATDEEIATAYPNGDHKLLAIREYNIPNDRYKACGVSIDEVINHVSHDDREQYGWNKGEVMAGFKSNRGPESLIKNYTPAEIKQYKNELQLDDKVIYDCLKDTNPNADNMHIATTYDIPISKYSECGIDFETAINHHTIDQIRPYKATFGSEQEVFNRFDLVRPSIPKIDKAIQLQTPVNMYKACNIPLEHAIDHHKPNVLIDDGKYTHMEVYNAFVNKPGGTATAAINRVIQPSTKPSDIGFFKVINKPEYQKGFKDRPNNIIHDTGIGIDDRYQILRAASSYVTQTLNRESYEVQQGQALRDALIRKINTSGLTEQGKIEFKDAADRDPYFANGNWPTPQHIDID